MFLSNHKEPCYAYVVSSDPRKGSGFRDCCRPAVRVSNRAPDIPTSPAELCEEPTDQAKSYLGCARLSIPDVVEADGRPCITTLCGCTGIWTVDCITNGRLNEKDTAARNGSATAQKWYMGTKYKLIENFLLLYDHISFTTQIHDTDCLMHMFQINR